MWPSPPMWSGEKEIEHFWPLIRFSPNCCSAYFSQLCWPAAFLLRTQGTTGCLSLSLPLSLSLSLPVWAEERQVGGVKVWLSFYVTQSSGCLSWCISSPITICPVLLLDPQGSVWQHFIVAPSACLGGGGVGGWEECAFKVQPGYGAIVSLPSSAESRAPRDRQRYLPFKKRKGVLWTRSFGSNHSWSYSRKSVKCGVLSGCTHCCIVGGCSRTF